MVALENHSACSGVLGDDLDNATRISAIADQIAEKAKALRAALPSMIQARVQGFKIAVDVGQQGGQQWTYPMGCGGVNTRNALASPDIMGDFSFARERLMRH